MNYRGRTNTLLKIEAQSLDRIFQIIRSNFAPQGRLTNYEETTGLKVASKNGRNSSNSFG
jgi:hypothetical protein